MESDLLLPLPKVDIMKIKELLLIVLLLSAIPMSASHASVLDNADKLSMELDGVPLPSVLNMIAQQNGLNLVLSGTVAGEVTLRLDNVDLATALEAILQPNGYNYYIKNDVIIVKPIEDIALGELATEIITLSYLDPVTAQNSLEALKSNHGKIVILGKVAVDEAGRSSGSRGSAPGGYAPNRVLISDYPSVVSEMVALIEELDKEERMISIHVKIIETKIDSESKLGISWPTAVNASLGAGTLSDLSTDGTTTESTQLDNVAASWNPNTGKSFWGTLTAEQVDAVLNMLETSGNSKLVSDPHLTTLENHEAVIKIETIIPIPTVNRFTEGAATQDILTFVDEEVGISLVVTPRINENGKITLDVEQKVEDIIGFSGTVESQKPITSSRSIKTRITVENGQTAALGGLLKEDLIETEQKVPLLGSIPLLGKWLFTSKSSDKSTSDLIILITPMIVVD